jgi:agmatine deiminase
MSLSTPKSLGYHFPAEWEKHAATWLSYPHNEASWPGKIKNIFSFYHQFIKEVSRGELVHINVLDEKMKIQLLEDLEKAGVDLNRIRLHLHPTNDAWCRDHGPAFVVRDDPKDKKAVINWGYNGWGNKYPHELDDDIPLMIAHNQNLKVFSPGIIMEGGSVDFNGAGSILTTTACLLNENRNPDLTKDEIEHCLLDYYGAGQVLWLGEGIEGDDTDGHVDDITRFVNADTIITMVEPDKNDPNHALLEENLKTLKTMRLLNGKQPAIVEIPMPKPVYYENQRLPASYANFYISNAAVIVPTFQCPGDQMAIDLLSECFKDRPVIGVDSVEIIWGLGSWHCLSQQEPLV